MLKVGLISLGCAKNLVDSELILGVLKNANVEIVSEPSDADAIIINTCGFIESAKAETIATIEEMKTYQKKLIVCGCYAERYRTKLLQEMPFIDRIITLQEYPKIHLILHELFGYEELKFRPMNYETRMLATSPYTPYVKISEGCNNRCAFCAIPLIRGSFRSRPMDEILSEVRGLIHGGAKEINLISQDTTRYGSDLSENNQPLLIDLLNEITKIKGLMMVRILYLYPDEISDALINTIKNNPLIPPYFDIPIQHIETSVLKRMLRRGTEEDIRSLFLKIKNAIPHAIFRTTLIVGFPGETDADFEKLKAFVKMMEFHRLGVFAYSQEEDTVAYHLLNQVDESIKQNRLDEIMKIQKKVSRKKNREEIGRIHHTIVESYDPESHFYYGRSYAFAPDDIDGYIVFQSDQDLSIGDDVFVKITDSFAYDLIGDTVLEGNL